MDQVENQAKKRIRTPRCETTSTNVFIPNGHIKQIDKTVEAGRFMSRSDFIRNAVRIMLESENL